MVAVRAKSLAGLIGLLLFSDILSAPPYPGYIFCACGAKGYLISPAGETVHIWNATSSAQSHADLLPDGSALFPMQPNTPARTLLTNPASCPLKGSSGGFPHGRLQQRTVATQGSAQWSYMYGPSYPGLNTYTNFKRNAGMEPFGAGTFTYKTAARAGKITVVNSKGSLMHCRIYSLSGKTIFSASTRGNEFVFSAGALTEGVYYIDVRTGSGVFRKSFVTK